MSPKIRDQGTINLREDAHVGVAPVVDLLAEGRFGVDPPGDPHRGHEQLRVTLDPVDEERHGHARIVDEQPFAGTAALAHRHVRGRPPRAEPAAPGHVAHAVGTRLAPFIPQQLQCHAAGRQVLLDLRPVHVLVHGPDLPRRIERRLQRRVVHPGRLRPAQAGSREPCQGLRNRAPGKAAVGRDHSRAAAFVKVKFQYLPDFPHGQPLLCHSVPPRSDR